MLNPAWIDWPVDTRGRAPCFHAFLKRSMEARHATATRKSGCFGTNAVTETRKLAAIWVSDVVGYSRLAGADEDRILARLRTLRSHLIDPTIAVHHGRIVKRTGGGSVIEFRSVFDAVNCAIEVQRAMVERNAEVARDKRIEFRVSRTDATSLFVEGEQMADSKLANNYHSSGVKALFKNYGLVVRDANEILTQTTGSLMAQLKQPQPAIG
jgi:hypothetical protein